jgi:hypothetical protein
MKFFLLICLIVYVNFTLACKCYKEPEVEVIPRVISKPPHTYLKESDLPSSFDWRNVNGTNYCSKVMTQQNPAVCGSCWAEAATGKLSDNQKIELVIVDFICRCYL